MRNYFWLASLLALCSIPITIPLIVANVVNIANGQPVGATTGPTTPATAPTVTGAATHAPPTVVLGYETPPLTGFAFHVNTEYGPAEDWRNHQILTWLVGPDGQPVGIPMKGPWVAFYPTTPGSYTVFQNIDGVQSTRPVVIAANGNRFHYVDSLRGKDTDSGASTNTPLKQVPKLESYTTVYLRGDGAEYGPQVFNARGTRNIRFVGYGKVPPVITGLDRLVAMGFDARNVSFVYLKFDSVVAPGPNGKAHPLAAVGDSYGNNVMFRDCVFGNLQECVRSQSPGTVGLFVSRCAAAPGALVVGRDVYVDQCTDLVVSECDFSQGVRDEMPFRCTAKGTGTEAVPGVPTSYGLRNAVVCKTIFAQPNHYKSATSLRMCRDVLFEDCLIRDAAFGITRETVVDTTAYRVLVTGCALVNAKFELNDNVRSVWLVGNTVETPGEAVATAFAQPRELVLRGNTFKARAGVRAYGVGGGVVEVGTILKQP